MEYREFLSERVYELRMQRNMTQKELGEVVGLTPKSISTIESALSSTSIEILILLAKFFDVSTDYLLGLKDEP